jgi:hypothetical protein
MLGVKRRKGEVQKIMFASNRELKRLMCASEILPAQVASQHDFATSKDTSTHPPLATATLEDKLRDL